MAVDSPLNLTFFVELGVVMLFAFLGAMLTRRFGQSTMIGYIVAGIVIGPYALGKYIGFSEPLPLVLSSGTIVEGYKLPQITVSFLAQIGLIFLLFFAGLKFSLSKLRQTGKGVAILACVDIGLNMFLGFVLGAYLGWSLIDTIFLAAIISMSSVVITLRLVEELKMEDRPETDVLVSVMVVEDFVSIILLAVICSFIIGSGQEEQMATLFTFMGIGVLFAFFIILAFIFIPANVRRIERIQSRENLILLVLGVVFMSSALAEFFNIAGMIGAFLVGMAFAETRLSELIEREVSAVKDAFVAIFFVWFGMMINPLMFKDAIFLLALSIPLVLVNEVLILSAVAYISGFSRKGSVFIGAGTLGRSEEAIVFASVGSSFTKVNAAGVTQPVLQNSASIINPFAGRVLLHHVISLRLPDEGVRQNRRLLREEAPELAEILLRNPEEHSQERTIRPQREKDHMGRGCHGHLCNLFYPAADVHAVWVLL